MRVFVAGATGVIGRRVVPLLVQEKHAVTGVARAASGIYNAVDDEPLSHRHYVDALAAALGVRPPRLPPTWLTPLLGSLGEILSRSLRISNRKLREECGWTPQYPSAREGWRAVVAAYAPR